MRRRPYSLLLSAIVACCLLCASAAQQRVLPPRESGAPDNPAGRDFWFREGRTLPDGSAPAQHLSEAFRQKARLRQAVAARRRSAVALGDALALNALGKAANGSSEWISLGPSPIADDGTYGPVTGRIAAIAVDQTDITGNTVYIGGAFGGLWRSTNAAAIAASAVVWTPLIDQQASLAVGAIAIKPNDGNVILVGTGEDKSALDSYYGVGILRSTDGGITWTQISGDQQGHSFLGVGVGRMAWSTANTANVVAATGSAAKGTSTGLLNSSGAASGLYYSNDAGATWNLSTVKDGTTRLNTAAHAVVYNAARNRFYAAVSFHGIYESADGAIWTRIATQPDSTNVNFTKCPSVPSGSCPFYRGELAVRADADDMFVWYASTSTSDTAGDGGVWRTRDGGATWTGLDKTGIDNCDSPGDGGSDACGVYQAWFYNMYVGASPNPSNSTATDLYIGAGNILKCTLDASHTTCANTNPNPNRFMNLTRVYGCKGNWGTIAHVHPDQHHIGFANARANLAYFANDGGIYRTLNAGGLNNDSCDATLPFENLNNGPLSLTQFVWGSTHPSDAAAVLAGAQDVGTSLLTAASSGANQKTWQPLPVGGDGGYNAFSGGNVLQSYTDANINICTQGLSCYTQASLANWFQFVTPAQVGGDNSAFYTPWILDPLDQAKIIIGTCRVWRGAVSTTLFAGTALSQKLNNNSGLSRCGTTDSVIYAIAAGGPAGPSGASSVLYAALSNGSIWTTTNADATGNWVNRTPPTSLNPGPMWIGPAFRIPALWADPGDPTGLTVYATIQGFKTPHVLKSIDGGLYWSNITGDLPDAPVNSIATDPDDHAVVYIGTDTGVYVSTNNGVNWGEVGPTNPGPTAVGFLPNVPVTRVTFFKNTSTKYLYAFTYGRGAWRVDLNASGVNVAPTSLDFGSVPVGTAGGAQNVVVTTSGTSAVTISAINMSPNYSQTNNCGPLPATLGASDSCTVAVQFMPSVAGSLPGAVQLTHNAAGSPSMVSLSGTGIGASLVFEDSAGTTTITSVDFADQRVNTNSAGRMVRIHSNGTADLHVTSISSDGDFRQSNNCPVTGIPAGSFCTVTLVFLPATTGARSGSLTVTSDAVGNPTAILPLSGNGTIPIASVSPASLDFGFVKVGTATTRTLTLTNSGTDMLNISSVNTNGSAFSRGATCAATLAAGTSCAIEVIFAPNAAGPTTSQSALVITHDAAGSPLTVSLAGISEIPTISAVPVKVDFSFVKTGVASHKTVTLSNTSHLQIALTNIALVSPNMSVTHTCGNVLSALSSCTVDIAWTPAGAEVKSVSLILTSDAAGTTMNIPIAGTAEIPTLSAPATVAFGGYPILTASAPQSLTITNPTHLPIVISSIGFSPATANFTQTSTGCTTLSGMASCTVDIAFEAPTIGTKTATLIVTNDGAPSSLRATLTGTGEDLNAPTLDKGSGTVIAGNSATFTVSISPKGESFVNPVTLSCKGLPVKVACAFAPQVLIPGTAPRSSVLTISTASNRSAAVAVARRMRRTPLLALLLLFPGMALLPPAAGKKLRPKRLIVSALLFVMAFTLLAMSACGGGGASGSVTPTTNNGTPPGRYTIQVVAASGNITQSTPITLTVH